MKIVESDNFGSDYPDEKLIAESIPSKELADKMCAAINSPDMSSSRYYKVVEEDYILQPGFTL